VGINKRTIKEYIIEHYAITLFVITALPWLPVLFVSFIDDDIQILGHFNAGGLTAIFQPFIKPDVTISYWRPLGGVLRILIIMIGGFHPFLFKLVSLLLYGFCIILFYKASEKIGIRKEIAFIFAVIFAVIPSHELQVVWTSDQSEPLFTIFILLSFISYYKFYASVERKKINSILAAICFLCAILVKEAAYTGILIPFIVLVSQNDYKKIRTLKAFRDAGIGLLIVLLTLFYRSIVIGGTPFSSNHFSNFTIIKLIVNFFIYIPLAFLPPEALEWLQSISANPIIMILVILIFLIVVTFFFIKAFRLKKENFNILLTGLLWYIVLIAPAVPKVMRWYVFAASIGLFWLLAAYAQNRKEFFTSKKILLMLFLIIAGTAVYDFNLMTRWIKASDEFNVALNSVGKYKNELSGNSLLVWVTPDKINRIPIMKLGVQQSIQWKINNDSVDVSSPFRVEMVNYQSRINLINHSDSTIVFKITNGRFLPLNGKSHYIIHNEILSGNIYGMNFNINTFIKNKIPQSVLEVKYNKKQIPKKQLYFDGKEFIKIE